jgi:N-hydroxyarylamine O-acetyltransferase
MNIDAPHYDGSDVRLRDYLGRVGLRAPLDPDLDTLRRLHVAHREAFLFENLSIQAGGGVSVALDDIERKFLDERRGGYCFEHNTLFAAVLRDVGFPTTALLGRVRRGPPERWCRTHMVLRVYVDGDPWLADVGFGGLGLLEPIPLREGGSEHQVGFDYMLRRDGVVWVLSGRGPDPSTSGDVTTDLYEFSEDPQTAGDVEVANHFTATHPSSMFRRNVIIQRTTKEERTILRHDMLMRYRNGRATVQPIDPANLPAIARDLFGIDLPPRPYVYEQYSAT